MITEVELAQLPRFLEAYHLYRPFLILAKFGFSAIDCDGVGKKTSEVPRLESTYHQLLAGS
jgi:hypothetical protein